MAKVTIIVPVYNVGKLLYNAINSIKAQTFTDYSVILVNDGSTDNSGIICDEYAAEDDRVIVIHKKNQGAGAARNDALDIAKSEYVYFMDSDDILEPNLLEENIRLADEHEADFVMFGHIREFMNKNGQIYKTEICMPVFEGVMDYETIKNNFADFHMSYQFAVWMRIYRLKTIKKSGARFTNQRLGEDAVFNLGFFSTPFKCAVFNHKTYYHYIVHDNSIITAYNPQKYDDEMSIALWADKLFKNWGYNEAYERIENCLYVSPIIVEIINLSLKKGFINVFFNARAVKKRIKDEKVWASLAKLCGDEFPFNDYNKIVRFLKKRRYRSVFMYLEIKRIMRNAKYLLKRILRRKA